jgi:hypothetical protein
VQSESKSWDAFLIVQDINLFGNLDADPGHQPF